VKVFSSAAYDVRVETPTFVTIKAAVRKEVKTFFMFLTLSLSSKEALSLGYSQPLPISYHKN
jgi:hypothetical protein